MKIVGNLGARLIRMKLNKQIVSKQYTVYDIDKAKTLYDIKKYTCRQLSMMKQENIRVAIKKNMIPLNELKDFSQKKCGYCFEYFIRCGFCYTCPISKKIGRDCVSNPYYRKMESSGRKTTFARYHEAWCRELGIWNEKWT